MSTNSSPPPLPLPGAGTSYRTVKGELQKRKEEEYSSIFFSTTIFRSHPFPLGLWWIRAESYARAIDHAAWLRGYVIPEVGNGRLDLRAGAYHCMRTCTGARVEREETCREGSRRGRVQGPVVKMHATDAVDATASLPSSTSSVPASRSLGHEVRLVLVLLVSCWIVQDRSVLGMSEPPELTTAEGKFYSQFFFNHRAMIWKNKFQSFLEIFFFSFLVRGEDEFWSLKRIKVF